MKLVIDKDYCSSPLWEYLDGYLGSNLSLEDLNLKPEAVNILNMYDGLWEQMYWNHISPEYVDFSKVNDKWINELQKLVCSQVQDIHPEHEFVIL